MVARRTPTKKLRSWRVLVMRSKGEYLGSVEARDRQKAGAAAIKLFDLDQDQRGRAPDPRPALARAALWRGSSSNARQRFAVPAHGIATVSTCWRMARWSVAAVRADAGRLCTPAIVALFTGMRSLD